MFDSWLVFVCLSLCRVWDIVLFCFVSLLLFFVDHTASRMILTVGNLKFWNS